MWNFTAIIWEKLGELLFAIIVWNCGWSFSIISLGKVANILLSYCMDAQSVLHMHGIIDWIYLQVKICALEKLFIPILK